MCKVSITRPSPRIPPQHCVRGRPHVARMWRGYAGGSRADMWDNPSWKAWATLRSRATRVWALIRSEYLPCLLFSHNLGPGWMSMKNSVEPSDTMTRKDRRPRFPRLAVVKKLPATCRSTRWHTILHTRHLFIFVAAHLRTSAAQQA